ncbi:hypothetical protein BDY21DRAFT_363780 [Lineolata rhizophorae]|uniref:Aminoglycoside phosphotransferase domain-containing protein n=1 Tax=Lineolata rhizophorae TaxID=578093 RepID=A0A6A6P0T7_9PEZI|nr:hypothetical protein BDY21DRAFT_363780 [Lineolata rhizophorae]
MHFEHLSAQHNDAVESEDDCRRNYVTRHLFRKLACEGRPEHHPEFETGPFKLFRDNLRPTNVLVTKSNAVTGVIDLEFTIAARKSWAFDDIFFNRLDEKYFGKAEKDWVTHWLPLLTEEQRQNMEPFVWRKMAERADRRLADLR